MYAEVHLLPTDTASGSYVASNVETTISSAAIKSDWRCSATNIAQSTAVDSTTYNQVPQANATTPSVCVSTTDDQKQ